MWSLWETRSHQTELWSEGSRSVVNVLSLLRQTCVLIISLIKWLDENFERLFAEMVAECPEAPEAWIGDQIVDGAFEGAFS